MFHANIKIKRNPEDFGRTKRLWPLKNCIRQSLIPAALILEHITCIIYDTQLCVVYTSAQRRDEPELCSFTFLFYCALAETPYAAPRTQKHEIGNVSICRYSLIFWSLPFSIRLTSHALSANCTAVV